MKRFYLFLAAVIFTIGISKVYSMTGEDVLAGVEAKLSAPQDMESRSDMVLANSDGSGREKRVLKMWSAGKKKRLIKFIEPAGIEGIGFLMEGDNELNLYLPAMNKIRRIEGGAKNEDFQGTDFSYNEMASYEYKKDYSAEIASEDSNTYVLNLKRKSGSDKNFDSIKMVVNKMNLVPEKIELYENGTLKKILTISGIKEEGKYTVPVKIMMENVSKKHFTEITMSDIKFDQGLEDKDVFSKRFLKKKAK